MTQSVGSFVFLVFGAGVVEVPVVVVILCYHDAHYVSFG